jgi:hypothetical protein
MKKWPSVQSMAAKSPLTIVPSAYRALQDAYFHAHGLICYQLVAAVADYCLVAHFFR